MALYDIYALVHAGMTGIMILPVFILWGIALCKGRRRSDPARQGITWSKVLMPAVGM